MTSAPKGHRQTSPWHRLGNRPPSSRQALKGRHNPTKVARLHGQLAEALVVRSGQPAAHQSYLQEQKSLRAPPHCVKKQGHPQNHDMDCQILPNRNVRGCSSFSFPSSSLGTPVFEAPHRFASISADCEHESNAPHPDLPLMVTLLCRGGRRSCLAAMSVCVH
jgi:hypothetical protein